MVNDNFKVQFNSKIEVAITKILENTHRTVFVLNKKKIVGVVSEGDILRSLIYKKNLKSNVDAIMNKSFIFLEKKDYDKAKNLFIKNLVPIIPVVNKRMELIDILTLEEYLLKIK